MASLIHLARRYFGSLSSRRPSVSDDAWARGFLGEGEEALWGRMPAFDQRHAIAVARRVIDVLPDAPHPVVAAALLHDVGKIDSGFGVHGRVMATLIGGVRGNAASATRPGRVARYLNHAALGAEMLRAADADELTSAWAAEHHLPERQWSVPMEIGRALKDADDD